MAHFAKLDENNVVVDILVVNNSDIDNLPFPDSESVGIAYLNSFLPPANYAQTSYNGNFRVRYTGIGGQFYPNCTATPYGGFGNQKPSPDFVFDEAGCMWIPPLPYPDDGYTYYWNFETNSWVLAPIQPPKTPVVIG